MSKHFNSVQRWQDLASGTDALGRPRKTHCKHGHKFPKDARWHVNAKGYKCRVCPECDRLRMQRKRANPEFKANEAAKMRRHRVKLGKVYLEQVRSDRRKKKEWLDSFKIGCARCSETHIACLEFHHRNPAEKDFLLSVGVAKYSIARLQEEVAKCEVICSNCHRKLHWEEKQKRKAEGA